MNANVRGVLLVVGGYVVTMGVAILIVTLAVLFVMESSSCSAMSRVLLTLWAIIAAVFLVSVIAVGVVTWKFIPGFVRRLAIVATHGIAMLVSYAVIAFGLMILFNC